MKCDKKRKFFRHPDKNQEKEIYEDQEKIESQKYYLKNPRKQQNIAI
jgi:hypothetical protein